MTRERVDISILGKPRSRGNSLSPGTLPVRAGWVPKSAENGKTALSCGNTEGEKYIKYIYAYIYFIYAYIPRSEGRIYTFYICVYIIYIFAGNPIGDGIYIFYMRVYPQVKKGAYIYSIYAYILSIYQPVIPPAIGYIDFIYAWF